MQLVVMDNARIVPSKTPCKKFEVSPVPGGRVFDRQTDLTWLEYSKPELLLVCFVWESPPKPMP